jgi:RNA recognition motif-containing protein
VFEAIFTTKTLLLKLLWQLSLSPGSCVAGRTFNCLYAKGKLFIFLIASLASCALEKIINANPLECPLASVLTFGFIEEVEIKTDANGHSRGFAFIIFSKAQEAREAIKKMNNFPLAYRQLKVRPATQLPGDKESCHNSFNKSVFVVNIASNIKEPDLEQIFSQFGEVTHVDLKRKFNGGSKGIASITFADSRQADDCIEIGNKLPMIIENKKMVIVEFKPKRAQGISRKSAVKEYTMRKQDMILSDNLNSGYRPAAYIRPISPIVAQYIRRRSPIVRSPVLSPSRYSAMTMGSPYSNDFSDDYNAWMEYKYSQYHFGHSGLSSPEPYAAANFNVY